MALQIKTFRITDSASEEVVNSFLTGKRVHHWEAAYSGDPSLGIWNILVAYEEDNRRDEHRRMDNRGDNRGDHRGQRQGGDRRSSEPRREVAPKMEHTPPDVPEALMGRYENIRKWRNQVARDEKVKPYVLFNNKQLEDIVKAPPAGIEALKTIVPDMSGDLFDKYGNQLLGLVSATAEAAHS
ncbi:MAG TPA: HRDC domain-containing protein [Candidatus Kapabacteria bacterium]|nr:HRDC domain-containing protein [Candidatus Kapabacteria bacterium]